MSGAKKYKKQGTCLMCCKFSYDLIRGHVYPEWAYRIGNIMEAEFITLKDRATKGLTSAPTGYFFCDPCERWLAEGEDELKRTFFSKPSPRAGTGSKIQSQDFPFYKIYVPKKNQIERAVAGILFKANYATEGIFKRYLLSDSRRKLIQDALSKGNPESDNFNFLEITFTKTYDFYGTFDDPDATPLSLQTFDFAQTHVRLVFAGLVISVKFVPISSKVEIRNEIFDLVIIDLFDMGHPLTLPWPNYPLLLERIQSTSNINKVENVIRQYSEHALCPCGLRRTKDKKVFERRVYGDCCQPMWFSDI